jgi:2-oxoglutarate ferredoxin oxidoreductase subunit alpha
MAVDLSLKIGGQAGQGMQTIGYILSKIFSRGGYHILAHQDYQSRIRGGHNFFQIRLSSEPVFAHSEQIDLLLALDELSINEHLAEVKTGGGIIYDSNAAPSIKSQKGQFGIPLTELAVSAGGKKVLANTVASGAALGLLDYDLSALEKLLQEAFSKKKPELLENNIKAARAGYQFAQENFTQQFAYKLKPQSTNPKLMINGNEAIALGALAGGCNFFAAYPMTPSTSIMVYLAGKQADFNIMVEQAEDEISALNMAIGASYAGARAMTATSGGGFALMTEALSLAGMTETPVVIALAQRPGPATGLPTRTEQGDLLFALHAGHGEFQRIIFSPGSAEEAFYLTQKAFNLADKYQIPVLILTDQYLADCYRNIAPYDLSSLSIDRYLASAEDLNDNAEYLRHKLTDSGVSPRLIPGKSSHLVVTDSDEHTEDGHLTEDLRIRVDIVNKRNRKLQGLISNITPPVLHGPADAELLLIGWGSTYGVIKEVARTLCNRGKVVSQLHLPQLWPFPAEAVNRILNSVNSKVIIENNSTGQLNWLLRATTGSGADKEILKYDGRPFSADYILDALVKMT